MQLWKHCTQFHSTVSSQIAKREAVEEMVIGKFGQGPSSCRCAKGEEGCLGRWSPNFLMEYPFEYKIYHKYPTYR